MVHRIKNWIRSYLDFSKKELNGMFMLFLITFIIFISSFILPHFEQDSHIDLETFKQKAKLFRLSTHRRETIKTEFHNNPISKVRKADYFDFDPNGLAKEQWLRLGLSLKQIAVIHNYEAKGGRFHKRDDLKKIYSITPAQYKLLEPHIRIAERRADSDMPELKKNAALENRSVQLIELNSTDSIKLQSVSGIGPVLASRIIRFRDRLGGFYDLTQLREVYGIDSLKFEKLKRSFTIDKELVLKIDLNRATFEVLRPHPYLNYKQMNAIIQFRTQHGFFKSIDDLNKIVLLNDEIIRKIEPYIILNP